MSPIPTALATPDDYAEWTGDSSNPPKLTRTLRSCTTLVLAATKTAVYAVDDEGFATDADVKAALRDATCIQASAWVALGIDPATGGVIVQATKKRKELGTAVIEYADTASAATARTAAYQELVPEARQHLRLRGLITSAVGHS